MAEASTAFSGSKNASVNAFVDPTISNLIAWAFAAIFVKLSKPLAKPTPLKLSTKPLYDFKTSVTLTLYLAAIFLALSVNLTVYLMKYQYFQS